MGFSNKELSELNKKQKISDSAQTLQYKDIEKEIQYYLSEVVKEFREELSQEFMTNKITEYVDKNYQKWNIPEFVKDGEINLDNLKKTLTDAILNRGILEEALKDPKIDEIRVNGRWVILVDNQNRSKWLKGSDGKRACFQTPEEQNVILNRLLFNSKIAPNDTYKLVNGNTYEGYRVSITYKSVVADSKFAEENDYSCATIRKFLSKPFTIEELCKKGTITSDIGKFCQLAISRLNMVCVGKTFSGKTSFFRTLCKEIPDDVRVFSIQDPLENDMRRYNTKGELLNDVVICLADDDQDDSINYTNTNKNLLIHSLRNAPTIVSINEIRRDTEFHNAFIIGQAGHIVNTTYHAGSAKEACSIFTNRIISITHQDYVVALEDVTSFLDIVICVEIIGGKRIVSSVSEIIGHDGYTPIINTLYEYVVKDVDDDGTVVGEFIHKNKMSDNLLHKFIKSGIPVKELDFIQTV